MIELLVVLAIIAALIGLLLPAAQLALKAVNRLKEQSSLKPTGWIATARSAPWPTRWSKLPSALAAAGEHTLVRDECVAGGGVVQGR